MAAQVFRPPFRELNGMPYWQAETMSLLALSVAQPLAWSESTRPVNKLAKRKEIMIKTEMKAEQKIMYQRLEALKLAEELGTSPKYASIGAFSALDFTNTKAFSEVWI